MPFYYTHLALSLYQSRSKDTDNKDYYKSRELDDDSLDINDFSLEGGDEEEEVNHDRNNDLDIEEGDVDSEQ